MVVSDDAQKCNEKYYVKISKVIENEEIMHIMPNR